MSEEDTAKRLLLDENKFLRRTIERLEATVKNFNWHLQDLKRLKDAIKPVHGDVWDVQAAINDVEELAAIGRLLQPKGRRRSNKSLVEDLLEERDRYKGMVATALLDEVLARLQ